MRNLFNWAAARLVAAFALTLPLAAMAATTYSTDHTVTGSETAYTSSAGNANVTWQNFNFRAAVDKDHMAHGYYFYLKDGDTDIGETDSAVKLDSITLTWGSSGTSAGIGLSDTPYLVVTTADDTPVILGVSAAGAPYTYNETSTFVFTDLVLASNAKYRFYFYKNDVTGLSVGATLTGATTGRVNGRYHNTSGDARADYNDICCNGGAGYSVNCSFVVSPLEAGDATVLETSSTAVSVGSVATPVVIEGKVADGIVEVGSAATVSGVFTVCGEATTLELTDSLTATAFYFPATVTIDASELSGLDPTGDDVSKTTVLLAGALKYTTAPTVTLPAATAGMIYETNITASGISVTVVKGVDCVETISGNTSWSTIKPTGWIDAVVGDKPTIAITYEGEEPVTLTFDEAVQAGSLTLTGNIVVEASAAATFGTVTAGAGSVVEMANMTITTQSGSGVYRYRSGYPSTVPNQGLTYEYVGTADPENPGTVNLNGMRGTVKTTGYMSITGYYPLNTAAHLDVVSGTTSVNCNDQGICGYLTVREGATLVNVREYDALDYDGYSTVVNVYGTLDMGNTRWTCDKVTINLYGGTIIGAGQSSNGALDFKNSGDVKPAINVYADSTISASVKFRNTLTSINVSDNVTLTLSGVIRIQAEGGGITKKGNGTLKFTTSPAKLPAGIVVEDGTLAFDTESDVDQVVTYTAAVLNSENMDYVSASNWKGTVVVSAVAAGTTTTQVALNKTGNANSYLTLNGISGDAWCAGSNYTVQPAITLAGDVNFQNGSSNKSVTFRKIAAGTGNLSLKSWSGCQGVTYGFTTLDADNYTGTIQLDGSVLTFNVGNILKAGASAGDKVLPLTVANNATVNLAGATLNGAAANFELKFDGVYLKAKTATITYADSTTEDSYDALFTILETLYTGYTPAKAGAVVTVLDGSDESVGDCLPAIYDYDSTEHTYTLKTMAVAYQVGMTTYYSTSLESVVEAAVLADVSATLLVDLDMSSLPAGLVVPGSYGDDALHAITLDLGGNTITGPANGYALVNAGADITITGDGAVEGAGIVSNATSTATTTISGGTYTATGDLFAAEEGSTIAVSGGTFNQSVADEYLANGFEVKDNGDGTYDVRDYLGWIYEAADHPGYTGSWSNEVEYVNGKAHIEDGNTYTANRPSDGRMVTVEMTLSFDDVNDEDETVGDAKAAVKLATGGFKVYTSEGPDGAVTSVWKSVTIDGLDLSPQVNEDYTFLFVLDLTNTTYTAALVTGDGAVTNALVLADGSVANIPFASRGNVAPVQKIEFIGAGSVTSIEGSYEDVPAPVDVFVVDETIVLTDGSASLSADQAAWLNKLGAKSAVATRLGQLASAQFSAAYLLNLDLMGDFTYEFKVTDITVGDSSVEVEVTLTRTGTYVDGKYAINGTLTLKGTAAIGTPFETIGDAALGFDRNNNFCDESPTSASIVTIDTSKTGAKFYKPVIE